MNREWQGIRVVLGTVFEADIEADIDLLSRYNPSDWPPEGFVMQ